MKQQRAAPIRQRQWLFTSESVAPGHPDKACDQISDLVLDFFLERDPCAKVAAETMISNKFLAICGEFKADPVVMEEARMVLPYRIRDHLASLYPEAASGFDWAGAKKTFEMKSQSPDIAQGVELAGKIGAGDQGAMFGFACDETEELMPLPIMLAQRMMERHFHLFNTKAFDLGSDAKCQITVSYEGPVPKSVEKVVLSSQHGPEADVKKLREFLIEEVINNVLPGHLRSEKIEYLINPTGRFVVGGPAGDTGLTGRKIIVDTYGGSAPHGGGAFSGKDPTKVDRSGAYMARAIAKAVILAGLSTRCLVQVAYAIGQAEPISLLVDFQGSGLTGFTESAVEKVISSRIDLTPSGLISRLNLRRPIYLKTATFGHFGRELPEFAWETSAAQEIAQVLEKTLGEVRA